MSARRQTASKLSYLGEWTESRENARASGEASLAQIGELARRLVETQLPVIAYTGRNKLTFKFKLQTTANEYAAERRISRRLDQEKYTLIRHIDQLFSFQCVYMGRFLICALKFVGTSFTDKRKVHRSANVRKRIKAHSRGFTSVKCPLSVTGRVSVLGALILKKQYINFLGQV